MVVYSFLLSWLIILFQTLRSVPKPDSKITRCEPQPFLDISTSLPSYLKKDISFADVLMATVLIYNKTARRLIKLFILFS